MFDSITPVTELGKWMQTWRLPPGATSHDGVGFVAHIGREWVGNGSRATVLDYIVLVGDG
jgi:hypothetical protein